MATVFSSLTNQGITTLAAGITNSATSVDVVSAAALGFTAITGSNYHYLTIIDQGSWRRNPLTAPETYEIIQVTAVSIGGGTGGSDRLTVVRGVDGTTGLVFALGDIVEARLVKEHIAEITRKLTDGTADLDIDDLEVDAVNVKGDLTIGTGGFMAGSSWSQFLDARRMWPHTNNACAAAVQRHFTGGTSRQEAWTLDFDQSTLERASGITALPAWYDGRAIKARIIWTCVAGGSSGVVKWIIRGFAIPDDQALTATTNANTSIDDTLLAVNDLHISPEGTFTPAYASSAISFLSIAVERFATDAGDTLNADACLIGVHLYF